MNNTELEKSPETHGTSSKPISDPIPQGRGAIYRIAFRGEQKYAVRESDNPRGIGDTVHSTEAEARKYARELEERDRDAARRNRVRKEQEEREKQDKRQAEDIDGFAEDKPDIQRKRIIATLNRQVRVSGKVMTRKERIRDAVRRGAVIRHESGEDRIYLFDGRVPKLGGGFQENVEYYFVATKIETEYARHLIAKRDSTA